MKKTETFYLRDMLDYALKLQSLAARMSREQYDSDETLQAAAATGFRLSVRLQIECRPLFGTPIHKSNGDLSLGCVTASSMNIWALTTILCGIRFRNVSPN